MSRNNDRAKYVCHPYIRDDRKNSGNRWHLERKDNISDRGPERPWAIKRKYFGFKHLEELSIKEPSEIMFVISNESNGFVDLFKQNKDPDWLFLLMKVTAKICTTEFTEVKRYILSEICLKSTFLDHLQSYVMSVFTEINKNRCTEMGTFFENCLTVCDSITTLYPKTATERLEKLISSFRMVIFDMPNSSSVIEINDVAIMDKITKISRKFANSKSSGEMKNDEIVELKIIVTPPEDFRILPVYPVYADMEYGKSFLRPNLLKGAYQNVEHYLDVQFRLLREDFIGLLRDAIKCYRENNNKTQRSQGPSGKKIDNIYIYSDVKFEREMEFVQNKLAHVINFNKNKWLKINWDVSKRLMYGSLLIFTANGFDNFFVGIVADRSKKYLENGRLIVELVDNDTRPESLAGSYVMAESQVYFEPYKCAMEVLKNLKDDNFTMEKYIVSVCTKIDIPGYLREPNRQIHKYNFRNFMDVKPFDVLNACEWPAKEKFGLDKAQYRAFKAALTNELTIIQGPPGTGKTFIGLKIMDTIINNLYNYSVKQPCTKPILVICYTNHALDQFMEGILQFTTNVARIGNQTKSKIMNDYTLKNITKNYRKPESVISSVKNMSTAANDMVHEITYLKKCKEFISENAGVLELSLLKNGMPKKYHNFFKDPIKYMHWLFYDYDNFNFDPIAFISNQELAGKIYNLENFLVEDPNGKKDNILQDKINDSDEFTEHQDIVIYSLTTKHIRNTYDELVEELNSMTSRKRKISFRSKDYYNNNDLYVEQLKTTCYIVKSILNYFFKMLALANTDSDLHIIPQDLFELTMKERWLLYFHWVNATKNLFDQKIFRCEKRYVTLYKRYLELKEMENIEILSEKSVVAMTTTGAAKHRVLLEGLQSPIVIVEEAAEILEAHIIASLTKHCQHLILIGDHKQLRPSTSVYKLAKDYHFDISLFERMVNNNIPYYVLDEQHRMRPEVSSLIAPAIYPNLINHVSVMDRPHIRGVTKDLFFLNHTNFESEVEEISSKSNDHEASFLIMFARHLILQDYKPEQVTILTTYNGQMFKLRSMQKEYSNLEGMNIQVVDNYQGEESDIILLSLVRSNASGKIGFLKTENRICVALSRARNGLYIIGNMKNLYDSGNLWKEIKQKLVDQDSFGDELTLECAVHRKVLTKVSKSEDFKPISEGGCTELCNTLLSCGHYCQSICHSYDREHIKSICQELCNKSCDRNHPCKKTCNLVCGNCMVFVLKKLPCGHQASLHCYKVNSKNIKCKEKVNKLLDVCGHEVSTLCHEKNCPLECTDRLKCGHACTLNCHKDNDPDHETYICKKPCDKINKMCSQNHKCKKKCHEECSFCSIKVDRILGCGHLKKNVSCGENIESIECSRHLPCTRTLSCGHKCQKKCFEKCEDCRLIIKKSLPECGHTIEIECKNDPERNVICPKKCTRMLICGHKCKGMCGDKCAPENCKELVSIDDKELGCGHRKLWVLCCDKDKEHDLNSDYVLDKCDAPCSTKLHCGDICSGTCGKCKQGRLHMPCKEKCNKINPCNHTCNFPCKDKCPPCRLPCPYSCPHSKCTRPCGAPCVPCQEPCKWKCRHYKCTNICSDYCNRPPCYEPCRLLLKCLHKCVGFCGEPCPPLCRVCDEAELTAIVFGNEDEPNARFVYLNDCKHTIEAKTLEKWMNQKTNEIVTKQCPLCKMSIVNTLRFKMYTKTVQKDISEIKMKLSQGSLSYSTNKTKRYLLASTKTCDARFDDDQLTASEHFKEVRKLWKRVSQSMLRYKLEDTLIYKVPVHDVESWTFVVKTVESFFSYSDRIRNVGSGGRTNGPSPVIGHFVWLLTVAFRHSRCLSDQQKMDIDLEMARGARLVGLHETLTDVRYVSALASDTLSGEMVAVRDAVRRVETLLMSRDRYSRDVDEEVERRNGEIAEIIKGLATLSDEERAMINRAMSTSFYKGSRAQGHWLKCKNGHIYCVTECGGPMEKAKCPECKETIGGVNHRYTDGTTIASEMDGAKHVAWSEANNMGNYAIE